MSELLSKWKPVITGPGFGTKPSSDFNWQKFIAEVLESQYQYNKLVFEGDSRFQGYSMPIVCWSLRSISGKIKFPSYLLQKKHSKLFSASRTLSINLPECKDALAIEACVLEELREKVEKLIYLKIVNGSYRIGPIMKFNRHSNGVLEYELSV